MQRKMYLPDFDRRDVPTVLDLVSGQLFPVSNCDLTGTQKGDIGWDGLPLILPGASLRRFQNGAWNLIQPWKQSRGMQACWLPKCFPSRLLLTTRLGAEFTIDLLHERDGGVLLEYQSGALASLPALRRFLPDATRQLTGLGQNPRRPGLSETVAP